LADNELYQIGSRYRSCRHIPANNQIIDIANWIIVIGLFARGGEWVKEVLA